MTEELRIDARPSLERPVLIAAFRGWNDGGQGASLAGAYLAQAWAAEQFAEIDSENFYDFQATRPMVSLVDGDDAPDRLAGEHLPARAAAGRRPRCDPAARRRAEPPLADVLHARHRASRRRSASSS